MKLSIIIPAYNEEKTITKVLDSIRNIKLKLAKEIIIVDDGSRDNTVKRLENYKKVKFILIKHKRNFGKGAAVRTGINASKGDIILIQDADLEYDPRDYEKLIEPILRGETSVVYGNRFTSSNFNMHPLHYIGNKGLTFITNLLYWCNITDMETGYKVFRKKVLNNIILKSRNFNFEPEITAKILKRGYKIIEVPITFNPRSFDEGKKINWKDGVKSAWALIKYRFTN